MQPIVGAEPEENNTSELGVKADMVCSYNALMHLNGALLQQLKQAANLPKQEESRVTDGSSAFHQQEMASLQGQLETARKDAAAMRKVVASLKEQLKAAQKVDTPSPYMCARHYITQGRPAYLLECP